jgi:hypothetical protein
MNLSKERIKVYHELDNLVSERRVKIPLARDALLSSSSWSDLIDEYNIGYARGSGLSFRQALCAVAATAIAAIEAVDFEQAEKERQAPAVDGGS